MRRAAAFAIVKRLRKHFIRRLDRPALNLV